MSLIVSSRKPTNGHLSKVYLREKNAKSLKHNNSLPSNETKGKNTRKDQENGAASSSSVPNMVEKNLMGIDPVMSF